MEATGCGRLLVCSYGAITRYDLAPGERRKIGKPSRMKVEGMKVKQIKKDASSRPALKPPCLALTSTAPATAASASAR